MFRLTKLSPPRWARSPEFLVGGGLSALALVLIPLASLPMVRVPSLVTLSAAVILAADWGGAALLIGPRSAGRPRRQWLAGCLAFSGLMAVAFLISYPNVLAPHGLLEQPRDVFAWIRLAWQSVTLLCLMGVLGLPERALLTARNRLAPRSEGSSAWVLIPSVGLALGCTIAAELASRLGPPPLTSTSYAGIWQVVSGTVLGLIAIAAIPALRRMGRATAAERWFTAAAVASASGLLLTTVAARRYTLGWNGGWIVWAAAAFLMAMALVREAISEWRSQSGPGNSRLHALTYALSHLDPAGSVEQLAPALCAELQRGVDVDYAALIRFDGAGVGVLVGSCPEVAPEEYRPGTHVLSEEWLRRKHRDASGANWVEPLTRGQDANGRTPPYLDRLYESGLRAIAHSPILVGDRLQWELAVASRGDRGPDALAELARALPTLLDATAIISVLIAPAARSQQADDDARLQITAIIRDRSFYPVYQPIVAAETGVVVGYEALTRFQAGLAPSQVFTSAARVGLETELELACLAAAIEEAPRLARKAGWLSLNASPGLVLTEGPHLRALLAGADRAIVLEVTEHAVVDSYGDLREALAQIHPPVRISVDDAGAGFASLRHVVELRPAFVKLDISLVRGLNEDPMRQAMVAGMVAFAKRSGCVLIAEGVETTSELVTLRRLGVGLAQGYLMGRPTRASRVHANAAAGAGIHALEARRAGPAGAP